MATKAKVTFNPPPAGVAEKVAEANAELHTELDGEGKDQRLHTPECGIVGEVGEVGDLGSNAAKK